jgi:hypothetical protein
MADENTAERTVAPDYLVGLVREVSLKKTRQQSIAGEIGQRVKEAAENGHLHRGAFSLLLKLHRMDEQKRDDFIRAFGLYLDIAEDKNLWDDGAHVGDLADLAQKAAAADAVAAESNAVALEKGISKLEPSNDDDAPADETPGQAMKRGTAKSDAFLNEQIDKRKKKPLPGAEGESSYTAQ